MERIIGPQQTVLVTCRGWTDVVGRTIEKDNISVANFHTLVSRDPALYLVALSKKRISVNIIRESKAFVVNFIPFSKKESIGFMDRYNGLQLDKFERGPLRKTDARVLDCPRIDESLGYLECTLEHEVDAGDHILFIGRIMHSEFVRDGRRILNTGSRLMALEPER